MCFTKIMGNKNFTQNKKWTLVLDQSFVLAWIFLTRNISKCLHRTRLMPKVVNWNLVQIAVCWQVWSVTSTFIWLLGEFLNRPPTSFATYSETYTSMDYTILFYEHDNIFQLCIIPYLLLHQLWLGSQTLVCFHLSQIQENENLVDNTFEDTQLCKLMVIMYVCNVWTQFCKYSLWLGRSVQLMAVI